MNFQFFAWLASLSSGFSVLALKLATKHKIKNPWHFNFLTLGFISALTIVASLIAGITRPESFAIIVAAGVLSGLVSIAFTFSLYKLDITVLSPLFSVRTVFGLLIGVFLLGEAITERDIFFIILIAVGGFFVSYDNKLKLRSFFQPGIGYVLLMMLGLSFFGVLVQKAVATNGFWTTAFFIALISFVTVIPTLFISKEKLVFSRGALLFVFVAALLDTVARISAQRAYAENYTISQAIIVLPFSMFFAFVIAYWKPGLLESHPMSVYIIRFIAGGAMIFAALQLG